MVVGIGKWDGSKQSWRDRTRPPLRSIPIYSIQLFPSRLTQEERDMINRLRLKGVPIRLRGT